MSERKGTKGLELWCRKMTEGYPGVKVDNMTTSWRDGLAFCAIIHHFRPDLIEFDKLNKDDIYHNNELAFTVAERQLGIPALLEPEDMVEYEVPDRLSILTYLSQFYQFFENQRGKSGARIAPKRPQSTPDHGIVSPASTSPPTKVQITIGRARREPCAKCGLPVFIAERLNVGKLLYHRTCFRCARCNSQLTLANYYETESGEFCCEMCPDEEKQISKKVSPESVLSRSLSDEEKTASLQQYSDAPDAYSTNFESALEYPLEDELRKSSTLTSRAGTEFSTARSHFFKSQMENSSESSSEDIPVELPKTKPPPLTKSHYQGETIPLDVPDPKPPLAVKPDILRTSRSANSSFPSDNIEDKVISVSEQTNDRFVTKDNVSSSGSLSVRARMKLFENNEDNKSDVNTFSSSSNQVPSKSSIGKKQATVIAIDDLEDFDNISRKDIDAFWLKSNNSVTTAHSDLRKESDIKSVEIETPKEDVTNESKREVDDSLFTSAGVVEVIDLNSTSDDSRSIIEISDDSQKAEVTHITIDSDSHKETDMSFNQSLYHKQQPRNEAISDDSFFSSTSVVLSDTESIPRRGYYTAYEVASPSNQESIQSLNRNTETDESIVTTTEKICSVDEAADKSDNTEQGEKETEKQINIEKPISVEMDEEYPENRNPFDDNEEFTSSSSNPLQVLDDDEKLAISTRPNPTVRPEKNVISNTEKILHEKDEEAANASYNPFEEDQDDVNKLDNDKKFTISSRPVPATRPKKKIIPYAENYEFTGTPDCLKGIYIERVSINPFEEDENSDADDPTVRPKKNVVSNTEKILDEKDEDAANASYNPFEEDQDDVNMLDNDRKFTISSRPVPAARPKKKIIPYAENYEFTGTPDCLKGIYIERISINPFEEDENSDADKENTDDNIIQENEREDVIKPKKIVPRETFKSYNPFEDDLDDEEIESPVKPVPVPTIRTSKASRPEPKPRDTLSITSRGSHGGSSSSISSGSAFGSARKKKPAPRPPVPFHTNNSPGSSLASPSTSVTESPNLSGTIRSRKTKRAPLPPGASTPSQIESQYFQERPILGISPIQTGDAENISETHKGKTLKDEENRNRQSQIHSNEEENKLTDKSTAGRWKRRKGQAPSRPIPERRIVKTLPISEIKRELETIEIQQQGLEKQGVRLEQIIREKCEGSEEASPEDQVPIEVEDLILQLFELVNEKNELFRRQAELMYLRRQQRLEEEYADVEYQIRCLMLQPEANKSDSDKVREENLISRLVSIVEKRNEIIECLEMDRRREAEEDSSISSQLNLYSAKRDGEKDSPKEREGKKDKKKKHKKLNKIIHTLKHKKEKDQKVDVDKDVDECELNSSSEKGKKKKFTLF